MINIRDKLLNSFIVVISIVSLIELIINKMVVFNNVSYAIKLWINSIVPSIFPFFIVSDILISYNFFNYIPRFIKRFFARIFGVNDNAVTLFFLSILSGFPSSAKNIRKIYDEGLVTVDEASKFLVFSHFANPLFILGTVSVFFLHDDNLGIVVLISHYLPNFILGICFRGNDSCLLKSTINSDFNRQSFPKVFFNSIRNSIDTLLMILGTLTCFLVMSSLFVEVVKINIYSEAIFKGIMEMTMGLKSVSMLEISNIYKVVISSMILSFGGFSVHMQVLSFIEGSDISYKIFFCSRIYHMILSGILAFVIYIILF